MQDKPQTHRGQPRLMPRKPPPIGNLLDGQYDHSSAGDLRGSEYPEISPADLPADILLERLRKVVRRGDHQWTACCPAHNDHDPSLSIKEVDGGKLLVYCFAGCDADAIMEAVGLDLSFLFPSPYAQAFAGRPVPTPSPPQAGPEECDEEEPIDHARFEFRLRNVRAAGADLRRLARTLGLPASSLHALGVGFDGEKGAWVFPEFDADRRPVGLLYRDAEGGRRAMAGSRRGLSIPDDFDRNAVTVYVAEGATDTAALHSVGVAAVGRSAAFADRRQARWLTEFLRLLVPSRIVILGDRDPLKNGRRAGEEGARALAETLSEWLGRGVEMALPGRRYQDVREQVVAGRWADGLAFREGA